MVELIYPATGCKVTAEEENVQRLIDRGFERVNEQPKDDQPKRTPRKRNA